MSVWEGFSLTAFALLSVLCLDSSRFRISDNLSDIRQTLVFYFFLFTDCGDGVSGYTAAVAARTD